MVSSSARDRAIYQRPGELLQNLIRFGTANPPGNEAGWVTYINERLQGMTAKVCPCFNRGGCNPPWGS